MKRAFHVLLSLLLLLQLSGGHLGVMQIVAWANMFRAYAAEKGVMGGLKDTLDGDHPCPMCCKLARERNAESERETQGAVPTSKDLKKIMGPVCFTGAARLLQSCDDATALKVRFADPAVLISQWADTPPSPPPEHVALS